MKGTTLKDSILCVFPGDTLAASLKKGEVKERYFNPTGLFKEIHVISFASHDIDPAKVQTMFGAANVEVHSIGPTSVLGKLLNRLVPDLYYWTKLKMLQDIIRRINPSVIRTYDPLLPGFLATQIGNSLRIPTVISVHGIWTQERAIRLRRIFFWGHRNLARAFYDVIALLSTETLGRMLERYSLMLATKVICAYEFPKQYVRKFRHTDIPIIYNRVDTNRFRPRDRAATRTPTAIHVGRLVFEKSPENLVKAVKDLPLNLVVVGDGELREYLKRIVRSLQIEGKVRFVYNLPHKEIHRLYGESDIFVMCMKIGGVSIPILEAMASGLPIIFTRGVYEDRKEIVEGIGIRVGDNPKEIAEALSLLLRDRRLRERLGRMGRDRILTMDGEKMERLEAGVYARLMNQSSC